MNCINITLTCYIHSLYLVRINKNNILPLLSALQLLGNFADLILCWVPFLKQPPPHRKLSVPSELAVLLGN